MLSVYHAYVVVNYLFVRSVCHVFVCRVHSAVCNMGEYNVSYQCSISVSSVLHLSFVSAHLFTELN